MSTHCSSVSLSIMNEPSATSVLRTYAFPKLHQYYTSKSKTCILEQYQNEVIQYFIDNKLNLQKFYNSSITKDDFISTVIKFIDNQNGTQNDGNYALKTAIKRLYTILQLHKHAVTLIPKNKNNDININRIIIPRTIRRSVTEIKKRERERMDVIYQLSASQSELSTLQQTLNSLKHMSEQNEEKYKKTVNKLQEKLNSEKTQVNEVMNTNKHLENMNKQLLNELNEKKEEFVSVNKQLQKHEKYEKMISDLQNELQSKHKQINEIKQMDQNFLWRKELSLGSNLDCLNDEYIWWPCTVIDIDIDIGNNNKRDKRDKIKIRYDAFDNDIVQSDEWIDKSSTRIAPYMTKAKDVVDIDVMTENVSMNLKTVIIANKKIYKQGFLVLQGSLFKSYKTRYFRLFEDGNMCYYKTMSDKTPIGQFNIKNMIETRKIKFPKNKHLHGFEIVTQDKMWRFQTDSDQICTQWIDVIHAVIQQWIDEKVEIETDNEEEITEISNVSDDNMKELKLDFKMNNDIENIDQQYNEHIGWMYNQCKFGDWTYRYCVLKRETLKCYNNNNNNNNKQKETQCIKLVDIKSCIAIVDINSNKYFELEIPTTFAFQLVTLSRIYTFACKSKLDINLWLTKIKMLCVFDVTLRNKSESDLLRPRRSSIVEIGCSLNKLATSFGRLIGVTEEHVTTTQIVPTTPTTPNTPYKSIARRSSLPAATISVWNKKDEHGRRRSAPYLKQGLRGLGNGSSMWYKQQKKIQNDLKQEVIEQNLENDSSEISDLDEYDD